MLDPLLLDGLRHELAQSTSRPALTRLQTRLATVRLIDPACGCGNFLVVAYRELRLLDQVQVVMGDSSFAVYRKNTTGYLRVPMPG